MNYNIATIQREYEQKRANAINLNQSSIEQIYKDLYDTSRIYPEMKPCYFLARRRQSKSAHFC